MTIRTGVSFGDSITEGTALSSSVAGMSSIAQGGRGAWVELRAERLANLTGIGPLLTSGVRPCWLATSVNAASDGEWSFAGAWTAVTSTDAFDKLPYGLGQYANGATKIASITLPSHYRAAVGFDIYIVDYAGAGNASYRVNGGAWTAMGQTLIADNKILKFRVIAAVQPGQTVDIRCADAAGTGVGCFPAFLEWVYSTSTDGLVWHNLGANGKELNQLCAATSGDRLAFLDAVKLGTGSPLSPTPNSGVGCEFLNDALLINNTTTWAADLTTFYNRAHPLGPVGLVNPHEAGTGTATQQANYRAQTKTTGASLGANVADLYDLLAANGFTANAGAVAAGFTNPDGVHPSQAGHLQIAEWLYWFARVKYLGLGAVPNSYPVKATAAATTYMGKKAAVSYAANAPIGVG